MSASLLLLVAFCPQAALLARPYRHSPSQCASARSFQKAGVVYLPRFLQDDLFEQVLRECRTYKSSMKLEKDSIAAGRRGRVLERRSIASKTFYSDSMASRLQTLLGVPSPFFPSDFPVELRHYPRGSGMQWHKARTQQGGNRVQPSCHVCVQDDLMYTKPQCECVFTLENDSNSKTEWIDAQMVEVSLWTEPNSMVVFLAGWPKPSSYNHHE
ncbi:MAG: hypothetical protein SGPRY_009450, partial [Prymnesium sp.]